jgi:predicted DNA-binding WGR domain protein/stalled ribosome alternative rescue factor ArfA
MNSTPKQIFVNQESKHNKFWTIKTRTGQEFHRIVETNHGRLGTKGKVYGKKFNSPTAAKLFVISKVDEKKRKGYVEIKQEQLDALHIQSAIIGTQNKLEEFEWVEILATTPRLDSTAPPSPWRSIMLKPVLDTRLAEPDYDPAIRVVVGMRSKHFKDKISIVLTADSIYQLTRHRPRKGRASYQAEQIDKQHELFDMCDKIKEAVSHSL